MFKYINIKSIVITYHLLLSHTLTKEALFKINRNTFDFYSDDKLLN